MTHEIAGFKFHRSVPVRFKDIDVGGHSHHANALVYFEEARTAYWREVVAHQRFDDVAYVLAEVQVRYHRRVLWPGTLDVGVRVSRVGRKHFEMSYQAHSSDGERVLSGRSVQVMYDFRGQQSMRLTPSLRACLEAFDGPFGVRRGAGSE